MVVFMLQKKIKLTRIASVLLMASVVGCSQGGSSDEEKTVTLQISGVKDGALRDHISSQLSDLVDHPSPSMTSDWTDETMTVELSPVENIEELAGRIEFGDARVVGTRTIVVELRTDPPTDAPVVKTLPESPSQPEPEPPPPYDAEKIAQRLQEAGAQYAKVENGILVDVNFFRSKQPVTDETIALLVDEHGQTPKHLINLNLYGANITDKSLKIIARIPSLEILNLNDVSGEITNQGIVSMVKSLPNLTTLGVSHSPITNEGLKPIGSLENLDQLILDQTDIGDDGLIHLKTLKNLETLKMLGTKVTDDGLVHLTALPKLKRLTLKGTNITGAGAIAHLTNLTKLEYLTVPRENFEDEHYEALKAAIPKLWK